MAFWYGSYSRLPVHAWNTVAEYQAYAMAFFVYKNHTPVQAAAIVANLMQESTLNVNACRKDDAGPGEDSCGLAQWNKMRLAAMRAFVAHTTVGLLDLPTTYYWVQLEFVQYELMTTHKDALAVLASNPQDETLAGRFGKLYEGFGDASIPQRNAYAKTLLANYDPQEADTGRWSFPNGVSASGDS